MKMVTTTNPVHPFPPEVEDYFPFQPRPGQSMMANEIYYGVLAHNHIAIEGAAGLGKTITCLSAILPIAKREGCTLLYATRTHTQLQRVIEELNAIQKAKGVQVSGISLHGRANMCLHEAVQQVGPLDAMELCQLLRRRHKCAFYENLRAKEIDSVYGCLSSDYIRDFGVHAEICPYYLGKALIPHCDVVALTYSYLVNPFIRSVFLETLGRDLADCIVVFDESHNLPDLCMNTMSLGQSLRGLDRAVREYREYDPETNYPLVKGFILHFQKYLESVKREYGLVEEEIEIGVDKQAIKTFLSSFTADHGVDLYVLSNGMRQLGRQIRQQKIDAGHPSFSSIFHFGTFLEHFLTTFDKPQYLHYVIISKDAQHVQYYIRCIDCRELLGPLKRCRSVISMSGTLEPIDAYLEICGFPTQTRRKVLPSPFDHSLVRVFTVRGLDVSYYKRSPEQYQTLANRCLEVVRGTPGNTALFCASYEVLDGILKTTLQAQVKQLGRHFYFEHKELTSKTNDVQITGFKQDGYGKSYGVWAGVCGGRNSEGVDFPGVEMLSVVIVGIPLARMTHSINSLITYYTEQFGIYKGKEYAYTLPAFRRTNQAAGRPIRTLTDYGVIVLLDERYTFPYYRRYLSHWLNENMEILQDRDGVLQQEVQRFYLGQQQRTDKARKERIQG